MIDVEVKGIKALIVALKDLPDELQDRTILKLSQETHEEALKGAARHTKPGGGRLYASLDNFQRGNTRVVGHDLNQTGTMWKGQMWSYSVFINFGTRPHFVGPKDKKALRWPLPGGGGFAFSKGHKVKGITADPYMERAQQSALRTLDTIVSRTLKEAF